MNIDGTALARVLLYYDLIVTTEVLKQKIVCPFHEDVNPSMIVDLVKGQYFCFGCQCKGNALDFIVQMEEVNELKACKLLAKIQLNEQLRGVNMKGKKHAYVDSEQERKKAMWEYKKLQKTHWTIQHSQEIENAKQYMLNRGFPPDVLDKAGCKFTHNISYPLMFPMLDNGVFKGWVCRTTSIEVQKKRKYLYNKGFSRYFTLSGTYNNKAPQYIVEGHLDMVNTKANGAKNVCAILGWKITTEQIKKLKDQGITHVISALDNDECGEKGTEYLKKFFKVTRFTYPIDKSIKDMGDLDQQTFDYLNYLTLRDYMKGEQEWH